MSDQKPMNVLITGASRGFGKAIAEKFAANGCHLFLTSKNELTLYQTLAELTTRFPAVTIKAKAFDVAEKTSVLALGKWMEELNTVPDVLINNAGILFRAA